MIRLRLFYKHTGQEQRPYLKKLLTLFVCNVGIFKTKEYRHNSHHLVRLKTYLAL